MNLPCKTFLALATAAFLFLPGVAAQTVAPDDANSNTALPALQPELGAGELTLAFNYNFPNNAAVLAGLQQTTATATYVFDCDDPSNILISGSKTISFNINPTGTTGSTEVPFQASFVVSVTRDLPGLKNINCKYTVTVASPDPTGTAINEAKTEGDFNVKASYYGLVQSKVARQIQKAGPQKEVPFQIQLDNFGNARTQIQFFIEEKPGGKKWLAGVPDDVILDSATTGGEKTSDTATFLVTTTYKNGWNNEQGAYRLKMKVFAAEDPNQVSPDLSANILIRVRGVYIPALEPALMLGAILGTALVLRMRRDA